LGLLLLSGCAANHVTAGVEVVETPIDVAPGGELTAIEPDEVGVDALGTSQNGGDTERLEAESGVDEAAEESLLPRPTSVAVIGDSLTLSAHHHIAELLETTGIDVVTIDGVESRRMSRGSSEIPPATDAIEALLEGTEPELWIIALGTNDVASFTGVEVFRENMAELLDLVPEDAPVIWVDLWIRDLDDQVRSANRVIRSELRQRTGMGVVIDWHKLAAEPGIIIRDGVHLTEAGQELFAASMVEAIDAIFR
jgi:lysophospholipase L1-like esterase